MGSRVEIRGQSVKLVPSIHLHRAPGVELWSPDMLGKLPLPAELTHRLFVCFCCCWIYCIVFLFEAACFLFLFFSFLLDCEKGGTFVSRYDPCR